MGVSGPGMLSGQFQMTAQRTWKRSGVMCCGLGTHLKLHSRQYLMLCQAPGTKARTGGRERTRTIAEASSNGRKNGINTSHPAYRTLDYFWFSSQPCVLPGRGFRRAPMSLLCQSTPSPCSLLLSNLPPCPLPSLLDTLFALHP